MSLYSYIYDQAIRDYEEEHDYDVLECGDDFDDSSDFLYTPENENFEE